MSAAVQKPSLRVLLLSLVGVAVIVGIATLFRTFTSQQPPDFIVYFSNALALRPSKEHLTAAAPLFALGLLSIVGVVAGQFAARIGLPRLTGYLLAGIAIGPYLGGLVSRDDVRSLGLVNALALALIAVQAGAEVTLPVLQRIWRSLSIHAVVQVVVMIGGGAIVFGLLARHLPFLANVPADAVIALSLLWGVLSFTRSPSVTLALLADARAKGPMSEWILGLVVVLDVLVLPIFTAALTYARSTFEGLPFEASVFLELSHELWESVLAGIAAGLVLGGVLRFVVGSQLLVLIVVSFIVTAGCTYLRYDTLFVFVVMGFVAVNIVGVGAQLHAAAERATGAVFVVFFALAGAKLDLVALATLWPVALALAFARVATTVVASRIGHALAKDPVVTRRYGWTSLVSQAGVTIGLASLAGDVLPGVGKPLATLVIAVIGINQLLGPILFKLGLNRSGEAANDASTTGPA